MLETIEVLPQKKKETIEITDDIFLKIQENIQY